MCREWKNTGAIKPASASGRHQIRSALASVPTCGAPGFDNHFTFESANPNAATRSNKPAFGFTHTSTPKLVTNTSAVRLMFRQDLRVSTPDSGQPKAFPNNLGNRKIPTPITGPTKNP